jgi:hypothetical protein
MQSVSGEKKIEEKKNILRQGGGMNRICTKLARGRLQSVEKQPTFVYFFFFFFSLPHLLRKMPGPRAGGGIVRVGDCSAGFFFFSIL